MNISIPDEQIRTFCEHHHIRKLSLFGSVLRNDFRPDSDVDVLVEFEPGKTVDFFVFIDMQTELSQLLAHEVDLNTPNFLSPHFRNKVLKSAQALYERTG